MYQLNDRGNGKSYLGFYIRFNPIQKNLVPLRWLSSPTSAVGQNSRHNKTIEMKLNVRGIGPRSINYGW